MINEIIYEWCWVWKNVFEKGIICFVFYWLNNYVVYNFKLKVKLFLNFYWKLFCIVIFLDSSSFGVGDLEIILVLVVIVCYLGIDLIVEGRVVCNWCGIVFVVYGVFLFGKIVIVVLFVKMYGVVFLIVDGVVMEVIFSGNIFVGKEIRKF